MPYLSLGAVAAALAPGAVAATAALAMLAAPGRETGVMSLSSILLCCFNADMGSERKKERKYMNGVYGNANVFS